MAGKKGMRDYPLSIKLKAVRLHLEEGMITREVCENHNLVLCSWYVLFTTTSTKTVYSKSQIADTPGKQ